MRRFLSFTLHFVCAACVVSLAGCADPQAAEEREALSVIIEPEEISLARGGATIVAAQVLGDDAVADRRITFSSRNPDIVRVTRTSDWSATLTAVGEGTTTVVASASAQADTRDSVRVRIVSSTGPTPAIHITAVTRAGTSVAVDQGDVAGRIDVHMEVYAAWPDRRVTIAVGSGPPVACGPVGIDIVPMVCSFDTAQKDASGAYLYPDGTYSLSARVVRPDGVVTASGSRQLTFNNVR